MALSHKDRNLVKSAVAEVIKTKGDGMARWFSTELAKEAFDRIIKADPSLNDTFALREGFNPKKGTKEWAFNSDDQKNALMDAWNDLRYEAKKALEAANDESDPRLEHYSQISGFMLRSAKGEMVSNTRSPRADKDDDSAFIEYVRTFGHRAEDKKNDFTVKGITGFRRALKYVIIAEMAKDHAGGTKKGDAMKKEYLDAIKFAEEKMSKLSPREKYELTLIPLPGRETEDMKGTPRSKDAIEKANAKALAEYDAEGAPEEEEEQAPDSSEGEQEEEESFSVEDFESQIEELKEELKSANKNRKKDINMEIAELEEKILNFQD